MTKQIENSSEMFDPDGSIFLFERLNEQEFARERFALMLGRGAYRGMEFDELEAHDRELQLRLAMTNHADQKTASHQASDII